MLRVRPVVGTPHADAWARLLLALGLAELEHAGAGERCFAADSGRVLIRPQPAFTIELGFEVRELDKFAQWTRSDGTEVLVRPGAGTNRAAGAGRFGQITAGDGLVFTARPVDAGLTAGSGQEGGSGSLGVLAVWNTPDVPAAARTLRNIGAQESPGHPGSAAAHFRARHGGFVDVRGAAAVGVELEFGIAGEAGELAQRLAAAGHRVRVEAGTHGATLLLAHPEGGVLRVAERLGHAPGDPLRE